MEARSSLVKLVVGLAGIGIAFALGFQPAVAETPFPDEGIRSGDGGVRYFLSDAAAPYAFNEEDPESPFRLTQDTQPAPLPSVPQPVSVRDSTPTEARLLASSVFGLGDVDRSLLSQARRTRAQGLVTDVTSGDEALFRVSTDAGNLLKKTNSTPGLITQNRGPIVTDPRIRGSQIGQLNAAGSFWFPVRPDLDTVLSKIDSRIVDDIIIVKGPYAARYGPNFNFIDVLLETSPRYANGYESHGETSIEFKTNGEQWYGRQAVWGGAENYGFLVGYGHRTGNDYRAGNGQDFIGSYNSRDLYGAFGYDFTPERHLEFTYLHLDQTGVELANQFLDIDVLSTSAYELTYRMEDPPVFDYVEIEGWHNETQIRGNANEPGKREQIPFLVFGNLFVTSNSQNSSTGFKAAGTVGDAECVQTTFGADLRYLTQQINQIFDGNTPFAPIPGEPFNQPLPNARSANPGLFIEHLRRVNDKLRLTAGARIDLVDTNAEDSAPLTDTHGFPPLDSPDITFSLVEALGGGQFNRHFTLGAGYVTAERKLNCNWTATLGGAYAMRAPTMTELYSVGILVSTFQQRTVTSLIGNPRLTSERRYQIDAGLRGESEWGRIGVDGYYAWITDYITWDRTLPLSASITYTQTDLATLAGFDAYGEVFLTEYLTAFATMAFVEGRDHTRNVNPVPASVYRPANAPRSGVNTTAEPLPMIAPMETRVGLVLGDTGRRRWSTELTARIVAPQNRVATSLGEFTTPGFTTLDLRGYWQATKRLMLVGGIENLTDLTYQEHFDARAQPFGAPIPAQGGGGVVFLPGSNDVLRPGINFYFASQFTY